MSVEQKLEAELATMPEAVRTSTLATVALDLAERLDQRPGDRTAVALSRELRLTLTELFSQKDATSDVEGFLRRIAAPEYRNTPN